MALVSSRGKRHLERALIEAAPAIWVWDVKANLFLISNRVREIYGFRKDQIVNREIFCAATEKYDRSWLKIFEADAVEKVSSANKTIRYQIERVDNGEKRWVEARVKWEKDRDGLHEHLIYTGIVEDITERVKADHALIESENRLIIAIEAGKMGIWEIDLETGAVTNTPELNNLFGFPANAKPSLEELRSRYAPGELKRLANEGATLEEVRARFERGDFPVGMSGDRTHVQAEVTIIVPPHNVKHLLYRAQYVYSFDGRPLITGLLVDITEKKLAEKRLAVMARELQHRVKNSLTVIQSIATQSFRAQANSQEGLQSFLGRLRALSAVTDMVLEDAGSTVDMVDIVRTVTAPYRIALADPFIIEGSTLLMSGKIATAMSMILHELCTNALKYGSLSVPTGYVHLVWQQSESAHITVDWQEHGGPEVVDPKRKGYGTTLIDTLVSSELHGTVVETFESAGLRCQIVSGPISESDVPIKSTSERSNTT